MSVDDLIGAVVTTLDDLGLANSTYYLYSSDHVRVPLEWLPGVGSVRVL
jgi:hypothetical protein